MLDYDQRLQEMIDKHNSGLCNCNVDNMELCLGGIYENGLMSKEEIFEDWD